MPSLRANSTTAEYEKHVGFDVGVKLLRVHVKLVGP